jgi:hypothetical protein
MAKIKPPLKEGLSSLVGRALLFLSGAGKEYKNLRKDMNDPEFKKRWNNMHKKAAELTSEYEDLIGKYHNK